MKQKKNKWVTIVSLVFETVLRGDTDWIKYFPHSLSFIEQIIVRMIDLSSLIILKARIDDRHREMSYERHDYMKASNLMLNLDREGGRSIKSWKGRKKSASFNFANSRNHIESAYLSVFRSNSLTLTTSLLLYHNFSASLPCQKRLRCSILSQNTLHFSLFGYSGQAMNA